MEISRLRQQLVKLAGLTLTQGEAGQAAQNLGASLLAFEDGGRSNTRTADGLLNSIGGGTRIGSSAGIRKGGSPARGGGESFQDLNQLTLSGQGGVAVPKQKSAPKVLSVPTQLQPPSMLSPEQSLAGLSVFTEE